MLPKDVQQWEGYVSERVKYFKVICYGQACYCNQIAVGASGLGIRRSNNK